MTQKHFIRKSFVLIILPTILFLGLYEYLYREIPNDFKIKKENLLNRKDSIETLIFGTSHAYNGIDPLYLKNAYNLANDGQTLLLDQYLYNQYIKFLPNIKNIILSISYHSLTMDTIATSNDIWKIRKNQLYMGVKIKPYYELSYWLECLHPQYYNTIVQYYINNQSHNACDTLGFSRKDISRSKTELTNLIQLKGHTPKRPINEIKLLAKGNQHIIESIIEDCLQRKINVYFVTTPCHNYYRENIDTIQYTIMQNTIKDIQNKYPNIQYLDFFSNLDFFDEDYDNNNHLSIKGAKKLSLKLSKIISNCSIL